MDDDDDNDCMSFKFNSIQFSSTKFSSFCLAKLENFFIFLFMKIIKINSYRLSLLRTKLISFTNSNVYGNRNCLKKSVGDYGHHQHMKSIAIHSHDCEGSEMIKNLLMR